MKKKNLPIEKNPLLPSVVALSILLVLVSGYMIYEKIFINSGVISSLVCEKDERTFNEYINDEYEVKISNYYGKYVNDVDSKQYFEINESGWKLVYKSCGVYSTYSSSLEEPKADLSYYLSPASVLFRLMSADQAFANTNISVPIISFVATNSSYKLTYIENYTIKCNGKTTTFDLGTFTKEVNS